MNSYESLQEEARKDGANIIDYHLTANGSAGCTAMALLPSGKT